MGFGFLMQGPCYVVRDSMMLGQATRYLKLNPSMVTASSEVDGFEIYDQCIAKGVKSVVMLRCKVCGLKSRMVCAGQALQPQEP